MSFNSTSQSTDNRIVSTSRAYVVYDGTTGQVLHIHHSVTFAHGAPVREDAAARARRLAGNKAGTNAEVLEVEPAELRGLVRIDTAKRAIIREKHR